ncbi:MAG TPA: hypothetical protein VIS55_10165, partial [Pseudomonadales bacterium]
DAYGLTDADLWDLVKMTLEGVIDTDSYIDGTGAFIGSELSGNLLYGTTCGTCHGGDGRDLNFGTPADPEYVGTVAVFNPWEFLHKVRFGHPGSPMTATDLIEYDPQLAADIGVYAQTLRTD